MRYRVYTYELPPPSLPLRSLVLMALPFVGVTLGVVGWAVWIGAF